MPGSFKDLVDSVAHELEQHHQTLVTAESCTGGMIAAALTDRSGISAVFERGFVTYSNQSKIDLLQVSEEILRDHGAVSPQTAKAMAEGALKNSKASLALSVTGIAGPAGGSEEKPVGLVYFGFCAPAKSYCIEHHFQGERAAIRSQATEAALIHLLHFMEEMS